MLEETFSVLDAVLELFRGWEGVLDVQFLEESEGPVDGEIHFHASWLAVTISDRMRWEVPLGFFLDLVATCSQMAGVSFDFKTVSLLHKIRDCDNLDVLLILEKVLHLLLSLLVS